MQTESEVFAFVLMPFAAEFDDIYNLGIKECASSLGIRAERVDDQIYSEGILDRIYRQIEVADIIIADMSTQNANVFYEVGYAHAKEKLCLLLTRDAADIPFDLKHKRHIVYGDKIQKLRDQLRSELAWAKSVVNNQRESSISLSVKNISGELVTTRWSADAKISFEVDLHNKTNVASAEIQSIYFYTGNDWDVIQRDEKCPSTDSDIEGFKFRHFLNPPIRRLIKSGWAQLRFRTERTLASSAAGDEIKDSYKVKGLSNLRLVTDRGSFDFKIEIDTVASVAIF